MMFDDENKKDYWDKPTWRERDDKNKAKSQGLSTPSIPKTNSKQKRQEFAAKKDLDELFKAKVSKEESKAWAVVSKLHGPTFSKAASEYTEKHGYPKDWGNLIQLLDHSDCAFIEKLLAHMKENLDQQTDTKKELFYGKLKVLLASCDDYGLSKTIQALIPPG